MNNQTSRGNRMRIMVHIAAWIILLGLPLYNINRWQVPNEFIWIYYINAVINGIIFYGNYLLLIPRYFFSSSRVRYYLSTLVLIIALFFISSYSYMLVFSRENRLRSGDQPPGDVIVNRDEARPPRDRGFFRPFGPMHLYNFSFNALVITIFALGLRILERHAMIEKRQKELEKEKLNSELAFLKNQISPHFFFNTLNNIYSLISVNAEDSRNAILKLSRMMRYLLYESDAGAVMLKSEIEFMNNYIDLMRLRMSDKVKLDVNFPETNENITVPPLLFISIIENAFKHGISYREKSFIELSMDVTQDFITFRCTNSLVKPGDEDSQEHTGIGLENLSKRLNLLFPDKHELRIERTKSEFHVIVKIYPGNS